LRHTCSSDLVALSFFVATLAACHGGGGGGSPTAPSGALDVHGDWSVVETVAGGEPQGQCWADHLNSIVGAHGDNRMTVRQNGSAVTIVIARRTAPVKSLFMVGFSPEIWRSPTG
jgi:hypothetical protein